MQTACAFVCAPALAQPNSPCIGRARAESLRAPRRCARRRARAEVQAVYDAAEGDEGEEKEHKGPRFDPESDTVRSVSAKNVSSRGASIAPIVDMPARSR